MYTNNPPLIIYTLPENTMYMPDIKLDKIYLIFNAWKMIHSNIWKNTKLELPEIHQIRLLETK